MSPHQTPPASGRPFLKSALVIGGGPSGLCAAIALRRAGVNQVDLIEIDEHRAVIGSELSISAPALRALKGVGVAQDVAAAGVAIEAAQICGPDGHVHLTIPFPRLAGPDLPGTVGITRASLHEVLWQAAQREGVARQVGRSVDQLADEAGGVAVRFADGGLGRYDLVVGADGVRSKTRQMVLPQAPEPAYAGQMAWRARVPRRTGPMLAVFEAGDRRAGLITVSERHSYLFLLVNTPTPRRIDRAEFPQQLRESLALFGGPVAAVRDDIVDPAHIHYSDLSPVLVPPPWHVGRTVLVGDAVHATTPHLAYGAGLAMEDGVVLGEEVGRHADLDSALAAFTQRRWERCRMVVENGLQILRWQLDPSAPGADIGGLNMRSQMAIAGAI